MAVWRNDDNDPGWDLARNGFVTKFHRASVLNEAVNDLSAANYRVVSVDAHQWREVDDMHSALADALNFFDYYGHNFDSLNDALGYVAAQGSAWTSAQTGIVLVILNFDEFAKVFAQDAFTLLDLFANAALGGALIGNRMLCLIGSNDPWLEIPDVGASSVQWNRREWLNSNRVN